MSKIKLVQVIADSGFGGGPKHVLSILKNIDTKIFELYLVCPPGQLSVEGKLMPKVEVFNFKPVSKFNIFAILKLRRIFNKIRSSYDPFGPTIIHSHGPRAGFMAREAAPNDITQVYTEHIYGAEYHLNNPINEWLQKKILTRGNERTDLIIAVSNSVKKYLIDAKLAPEEKIKVIPNGIEINERSREYKKRIKLGNKHPIIGTVGNLNLQKGQIYLVEAMKEILKKYPLATLEIIGDGSERQNLEQKIEQLDLGHHITLLGYKTDINQYLWHWDAFVLPSISETFGIVVLEAMNAGVPVVASKVGGVSDIIHDDRNGILIKPREPELIAENVIEILEHPALAAKLKREGKERVKDFDWKEIVKILEKEYIRILK